MRKRIPILLLFCLFLFAIGQAQVSKTINVITPGTLSTLLTANELSTVTDLTITGNIDARDFKTMRDNMAFLAKLDIGNVKIKAYTGTVGTNNDYMTITYPDNEIPQFGFCSWTNSLSFIIMPSTIKSIGSFAFYHCSTLKSVSIPANVTNWGTNVFDSCDALDSINLAEGLTTLGTFAFRMCSALKNIKIPSSLKSWGDQTFQSCTALRNIVLGNTISCLGDYAFQYCSSLDSVAIPSSLKTWGTNPFDGCTGLKTVELKDGLTHLGNYSFYGLTGLKTLSIPTSVTNLGSMAFENCSGLLSICSYRPTPIIFDFSFIGPFEGVNTTNCTLYVPAGSKSLYQNALFWKDFKNIIEGATATVITHAVTNINSRKALGNGTIVNLDRNLPTQYGVVWNTTSNASIDLPTKTVQGTASTTGTFNTAINGLNYNTTYYLRAYVTNVNGTNYGNEVTFKTLTPKTLTISDPIIVINKMVDGNTNVVITKLGTLQGVDEADVGNVSVTATANYDNASIGTNKTITVVYSLTGSAKDNYFSPENFKISNAKISDYITTITNPTIVTNKMVDGNTNVTIIKLGTFQGVDAVDTGNVSITATANYDNSSVGTNKTITVVYTLSGSAGIKYRAPTNYVINNAKISDYVTLNTLATPAPGCEGDNLDLSYAIKTGTPTQYKITFDDTAQNAGLKNIPYTDLPSDNILDILSLPIPAKTADGTFSGTLKMNNELNVESPDYPFTFTINVSSNYIRTKFNMLVMFDNSGNRFSGYQWYKNNIEVDGATKQFYVDPDGLTGSYSVKLTTTNGSTLYSCPIELNKSSVKAQVTTFPNPVKENEPCTVQLAGLTDEQLKVAKLSVYNIQGICVFKSSVVKSLNQFNLALSGAYIGHLTTTGIDYVFKIIVGK